MIYSVDFYHLSATALTILTQVFAIFRAVAIKNTGWNQKYWTPTEYSINHMETYHGS